MTLAPWAITKPARSDVSVTGTYGWNAPENNASYPDRWKFPDCP